MRCSKSPSLCFSIPFNVLITLTILSCCVLRTMYNYIYLSCCGGRSILLTKRTCQDYVPNKQALNRFDTFSPTLSGHHSHANLPAWPRLRTPHPSGGSVLHTTGLQDRPHLDGFTSRPGKDQELPWTAEKRPGVGDWGWWERHRIPVPWTVVSSCMGRRRGTWFVSP